MEIELMKVETKLGIWVISTNTYEMNVDYEYYVEPPIGYNFNTAHALYEASIADCYSHIHDDNIQPCDEECGCFYAQDLKEGSL